MRAWRLFERVVVARIGTYPDSANVYNGMSDPSERYHSSILLFSGFNENMSSPLFGHVEMGIRAGKLCSMASVYASEVCDFLWG